VREVALVDSCWARVRAIFVSPSSSTSGASPASMRWLLRYPKSHCSPAGSKLPHEVGGKVLEERRLPAAGLRDNEVIAEKRLVGQMDRNRTSLVHRNANPAPAAHHLLGREEFSASRILGKGQPQRPSTGNTAACGQWNGLSTVSMPIARARATKPLPKVAGHDPPPLREPRPLRSGCRPCSDGLRGRSPPSSPLC
jgi:hypothetical protein